MLLISNNIDGGTIPSKRLDERGRDDDHQFSPVCDCGTVRTQQDAENEPARTHALSPKYISQPSEKQLPEQVSNRRSDLNSEVLVGG